MSTNFFTITTTVNALLSTYNTIMVPKWFQRNHVWNRPTQINYLQSVFDNFATTPIVLANVLNCAQNHPSKNYDTIINTGSRYVSMDGQNRTETLWRFRNNEITFTGTVTDRGNTYTYKNCYFKDLDPAVRYAFLGASIVLQEYSNLAFESLPRQFRSLNDGMPLNPQEKRNSEQTYIAHWVRERSGKDGKYYSAIGSCFKEHARNRMQDAEHIVKFLVHARALKDNPSQRPPVAKSVLDQYYAKGTDTFELSQGTFSDRSMSAYGDELSWLDSAMEFHRRSIRHYEPSSGSSDISNLLLSMWFQAYLWSQNKSIKDYGLNERNYLNMLIGADEALKKADKSGDGYREHARVNWQGSLKRCKMITELFIKLLESKSAA